MNMAISQNRQPIPLADICEVRRGMPMTRKETVAGDVPVIAGGQTPAYYHNEANRTGEVITVSGSGAYAGFVNFFERPIFASDCSTLQAKAENALMKYVYLAMKSRQTDIYALRIGSAQPHVYAKDVAKITIPLPPIAEQKRIVAVLGRRFAAVEKARAAALERVDAVRALPAAWLREVFSFGGEGLPRGWRWEKLGDICDFIRGVTFKRSDASFTQVEEHLPVLRAGNIGDQLDTENNLVWIPKHLVSKEQLLQVGDIAICMASGSPLVVGKAAPLENRWAGSVGAFCGIARAKDKEFSQYLSFWFRSPAYFEWRDSQARGANIQNLRFSEFSKIEIPFPPLAQQKRLVASLNAKMASTEKARAAAEAELEAITALPAALLREAFSGAL